MTMRQPFIARNPSVLWFLLALALFTVAITVMRQAFGVPAFPVDTHIHRLAWRWGLSTGHSVERTEADLKKLFPEQTWNDLHIRIIYFGREHCPAKGHDPHACPICSAIGRRELFR